jgi:hypothetical protein
MDTDEKIGFVLLLLHVIRFRRKRMHKKRHCVHPLICCRLLKGHFYTPFGDLRANEAKFFNYFRMSSKSYDELLIILKHDITGETPTCVCVF